MALKWFSTFAQQKRIVAALLLALVSVSCTSPETTPAIVNVTIDDGERVVEEGSTLPLTVTVQTQGSSTKAVLWSSDAPETASVSSTGVVSGMSAGEAHVTATSVLDTSKTDTVTITVTPPPVAPEVLSVSIDSGDRSVLVGETLPLSASVDSVGGATKAVTWTSDDTTTATVNAAGVVTGVTVGEALITATSEFDASMRDSTLISVAAVPPGAPARISVLTGDNQTATVGSAVPIRPTVRVRDADENPLQGVSVTFTVTFGSGTVAPSTPVTTNADGIAALSSWTLGTTAGRNGVRATVTESTPPISATFSATGEPSPASPQTSTVTANPTSLLANGSATSQLTIQLKDAYGNDLATGGATVTFATPNQGSIGPTTDNGNGTYTATYTAGETAESVTITPRVGGKSFSNTTIITLTATVTDVTIHQDNPSVVVEDTLQLTATVATIGGASSALTWTSSNTSVATINPTTGLVTGIASGTTTITATSTFDATMKDNTTLAVNPAPAVESIVINEGIQDLVVGESVQLSASITVVGGADTAINWSTSAPDVAIVDATGFVSSANSGSAEITASSVADPSKTASVTVTVAPKVSSYAVRAGGTGTEYGTGISALGDESAIVTGLFDGSAAFGGTTLHSASDPDVFVAKLNANGTWMWATAASGSGRPHPYGISALGDGSAIITGRFSRSAVFGSTELTSAGDYDVFVAKVNADGSWAWASHAGGPLEFTAFGISTLADGSAIITGSFAGAATFGTTTLTNDGAREAFVAKLHPNGTWAWATRAGGELITIPAVSSLDDGGALVTGTFRNSATFGATTLSGHSATEAFVARVAANGEWVWATKAGSPTNVQGSEISALGDGAAIVTGFFGDTATFGSTTITSSGRSDVYAAKINANGTWAWVAQAGGGSITGTGVSALGDGSSIMAGNFHESATFTFGSTTLEADEPTGFIAKLDPHGTWQWASKIGDQGIVSVRDISALGNGRAISTGVFRETASFGKTVLSSAGEGDVLVTKLSETGTW